MLCIQVCLRQAQRLLPNLANSVSMVTFYYLDDLKDYDFCLHAACPTSRNLILIELKNEKGQKKKFRM